MTSVKIIEQTKYRNRDVFVYELKRENGLSAIITNYGCILMSLNVPCNDGSTRDVVLGFDNVEDYWEEKYLSDYPYFGAIIGRYANRIKKGEFEIGNETISLSKNKSGDTLHGGFEGFDKKVWEVVEVNESSECSISLKYISEDGEEGFTGKLTTIICFSLLPEGLKYTIEATTDRTTAINLSHHSYFNLDELQTQPKEQLIRIHSDYWLEQDAAFCVTGKQVPMEGGLFDFKEWKPVQQSWNIADGYDQSFVLSNNISMSKPGAEAKSSDGLLYMSVYTTEPVIHFYTGKWIPTITGKGGKQYEPFSGYCFETHGFPNAVNVPDFPSTLLQPGENYTQSIQYIFECLTKRR
ncbi:MAG: aldose epimerase family protein [Chitinophagaceae bacterium]